jgi:hypothetical protein
MDINEASTHLKIAVRAGVPAYLICDANNFAAVQKASQGDSRDVQLGFQLATGSVKSKIASIDAAAALRQPDFADEFVRLTKAAGAARLIVCDLEGLCGRAGRNPHSARAELVTACQKAGVQIIV